MIRDIVKRGEVIVAKITLVDNLADPFTKALTARAFDRHVEGMRIRCMAAFIAA